MDEAGADIIAVTDPGQGLTGNRPAMLLDGHDIGEDLTRVALVAQAINHWHAGPIGQPLNVLMTIGADHDGVHHSRQDLGGVINGLAAPQLHVVGRGDNHAAAQLAHGRVERKPRPGRVLLKDHRQGAAHRRSIGVDAALGPALARRLAGMGGAMC